MPPHEEGHQLQGFEMESPSTPHSFDAPSARGFPIVPGLVAFALVVIGSFFYVNSLSPDPVKSDAANVTTVAPQPGSVVPPAPAHTPASEPADVPPTEPSAGSSEPGYLVQRPCARAPQSASVCEANVRAAIPDLPSLSDAAGAVGARIGQILATPGPNFLEGCCSAGTEFDRFLLQNVTARDRSDLEIGPETALLVIDMQKDFTEGSFGQPCWSAGNGGLGLGFAYEVAGLIGSFASNGALIVASKDMHPHDHCSFQGEGENACMNTKDYESEERTADQRYVNEFPSHCSFEVSDDGQVVPQSAPATPFCRSLPAGSRPPFCSDDSFVGIAFDDVILEALSSAPVDQVEVVYKGFDTHFDSFSAMPHLSHLVVGTVDDEERARTGGYALPLERARNCHGGWESHSCYPTIAELTDAGYTAGAEYTPPQLRYGPMRSLPSILRNRSITKLVVVGLVYDFCVSETAIFGVEGSQLWLDSGAAGGSITVLADLTRPSFDGKPGAPYTAGICDGHQDPTQPAYCSAGGGTLANHNNFKFDLEANGVVVERQVLSCIEAA